MSTIPFAEIRAWMFDAALPFWADAGIDRVHGGFLEELSLDGAPTDIAFKRTRVTCRQVYVFAHAQLLGWRGDSDALTKRGCDYLVERAWQGEQGFARPLTRAGDVLDPTADLYDTAFALFAFAWRYRTSGDKEALVWAHRTLDFIERRMAAPNGGYWHSVPVTGPRSQNPHMHLFEASLAAFEATGEHRFMDMADGIADLFRRRLFDGQTLGEFFEPDWTRIRGDSGRVVLPGHQFEWAWILAQHERIKGATDDNVAALIESLVRFGERHGVDLSTHATFNQVRDDGEPIDPASRTWPNTERIKAHVALFELGLHDSRAEIAQSTRLLLDRYLNVTPRGSLMDEFDAEGRPLARTVPASTLYHVFLAFAEVLRLEPKLSQTP